MQTEDFLRVINEFDFISDDIAEITEQLSLSKTESQKISQALINLEKAKEILTDLFPNIKSLDFEIRQDLEAEFADMV
ncbi:MAG: hypothetical protein PVG70_01340 [Desulfobacterales bacterium]|jgi:hypothetical protein